MNAMTKIGTKVIAYSGMCGHYVRLGMVADHVTDRWGTHHLVLVDGKFETVGHIGSADMKSIGWKVATEMEIKCRVM